MEGWAEVLHQAGYKLTPTRMAVLRVLGKEEGAHLSHDEVLEAGQRIEPSLSRATVYRTLDLFSQLGLCLPIVLGDGIPRFLSCQNGHHHHFVCRRCHRTFHFPDCAANGLEESLSERFGFRIEGHLVEFYGLCGGCRQDRGESQL
jgi:Fur family ferric uptake transcriptional regulator